MLYYYANTGHKIGLERLRRGVALLNRLKFKGIETQLLVNDFRAGLTAKELGVGEYVTIETIQDIDAIALPGNSVMIDSDENDHGRLVKFVSDFKNVWRFEHDATDVSVHGEVLLREAFGEDEVCAVMVGDEYFEQKAKVERTLFFLSDSDYDKIILSNEAFFQENTMELLLGGYFFVKYEKELQKLFSQLHEPEEYTDLITTSSCVVTCSSQTALEAKASGAKVIFIDTHAKTLYANETLEARGILVIDGFQDDVLKDALQTAGQTVATQKLIPFDDSEVVSKLLNG